MSNSCQIFKLTNPNESKIDRKKQFLKWLSSQKGITFTLKNIQREQSKERIISIKKNIQDPNLYVWQDFLTIFQFTYDQFEKLNLLMPKGFSLIPKENIPENIKIQLGHYARRMNSKIQYEKKEAQQTLKNPTPQVEYGPKNQQCFGAQYSTMHHQNSKQEQPDKKQAQLNKERDFVAQNKIVLRLKKGQKMVDDLSVFAHPVYQRMHNIVILKRLLHPVNFAKQKEKQIKKQRENQRIRKIKEAREAKLEKLTSKNTEQRRKQIKSKKQERNSQTNTSSKNSSKKKLSLLFPNLNLQLVAIKQLIQKLQKHQYFTIFQQGNTNPTIKFLLKILRSKIQQNYKICQFEADLLRIFKVYFKTSNEKMNIVRDIKNYQKFMISAINDKKMIFVNSSTQSLNHSKSQRKFQKVTENKNKCSQKSLKYKAEGFEIKDIQKLGKNVCRLSQKNVEQFCIQFCGKNSQKQQGEVFLFQFDFNQENSARLIEMEKFVRQKLEKQKSTYVSVSDEDVSEQFIIENDD